MRLITTLRHSPRPDERHGVVKQFVEERGGCVQERGGTEDAVVDDGAVDG